MLHLLLLAAVIAGISTLVFALMAIAWLASVAFRSSARPY